MNAWRLLRAYLKMNLQMSIAYRTDMLINLLLSMLWLGVDLLGLTIIFSNTQTLGGWGPGELVALLGVFRLVNTLMAALIWPGTEHFNESVRDGSFDYTMLQPVNSLFQVTFSRITIWRAWDLVVAAGLIITGIRLAGELVTPGGISLMLLLSVCGAAVIYSLWIVMIAFTFWFTKFDNNVTILQALLDAGRYPATIYPSWLRIIVTFVIPIAVATTVPMQALRGDLPPWQILLFIVIAVICVVVALRVWKAGVRRYNSASS
jgi:ABC-2 type transport system permease protein